MATGVYSGSPTTEENSFGFKITADNLVGFKKFDGQKGNFKIVLNRGDVYPEFTYKTLVYGVLFILKTKNFQGKTLKV